MGCIDHLQLIIPCPPGADGNCFPTSFLISARTPWALIHESCSDIRLMYAALISLTLQGVKRLGDAPGILMLNAISEEDFSAKRDVGDQKRLAQQHIAIFCYVSAALFL